MLGIPTIPVVLGSVPDPYEFLTDPDPTYLPAIVIENIFLKHHIDRLLIKASKCYS
jgi:hypothetical protein